MKETITYPLRLPASLQAAVAEISRAEGTSINQFIAMAVAEKVSAMKTAEFFAARSDEAGRGGSLAHPASGRRGASRSGTMRSPRIPLDRERAGLPFCAAQEVPDDPVTSPPP